MNANDKGRVIWRRCRRLRCDGSARRNLALLKSGQSIRIVPKLVRQNLQCDFTISLLSWARCTSPMPPSALARELKVSRGILFVAGQTGG